VSQEEAVDLPVPAAEEQGGAQRRHREDVHVLGQEEHGEAHAGVLGVEPADDLLLGLDEVEGRPVGLGHRRDHEDDEGPELGEDVPARAD
jgi:hypothetical protein